MATETPLPQALQITLSVTKILEKLKIPYFVGGSLASSLHGIPRATLDADLVVDLSEKQAEKFVSSLKEDYYVDDKVVRTAIERSGMFNIIHLESMFKIDVHILKKDESSKEGMKRRQRIVVSETEQGEIYVASPEDVVLQKLNWFKKGDGTSDRQWEDALGVLKVQGNALDLSYMTTWSEKLGITDLLQKALNTTRNK
ncbi:hypothetical protein ACFLU6_09525 [Acidobacteriota bacterium]